MIADRNARIYAFITVGLVVVAAALFWFTSSQRERELLAVNTLFLAGWTCLLAVPIGTLLALMIARTDLPLRRTFGVLMVITLFLPLYTQTAAWQAGFGQQGSFAHWLDGWRGAIWIHACAAIPWVVVIVALALRNIEPQLEEAAMLNASPSRVFWHVTLRRSWFAILAATVWISVQTAGEFTVTDMWWLRTHAEDIFRGFAVGETPEETAFGILPSVAATSILLLAILIVLQRWLAQESPAPTRPLRKYELGFLRWPAFLLASAVVVCLLGVPLANLCVQLGMVVNKAGDGSLQRTWSMSHALEMFAFSTWEFRREVIWSLGTSVIAAASAVVIAVPLVWFACRRDKASKLRGDFSALPMIALAAVLLAIPGPLLGIGLSWLFNAPNWSWLNFLYDRSITAPTVALTLRALPIVMIVLWYALRSVPQKTLDAAAVDGAGFWRQLGWVALPQRKLAIAAAWLIGVVIALGDLSASFLVLPPGVSPLSRRIFEEVHYGVPDQVAGITLVTMLLSSTIVLVALLLFWLAGRRTPRSTW